MISQQVFMRSFVAPPGTPAEQIGILRTASTPPCRTRRSWPTRAKMKISITPLPGAKVQELIEKLYATPKEFVERAKAVIKPRQPQRGRRMTSKNPAQKPMRSVNAGVLS